MRVFAKRIDTSLIITLKNGGALLVGLDLSVLNSVLMVNILKILCSYP